MGVSYTSPVIISDCELAAIYVALMYVLEGLPTWKVVILTNSFGAHGRLTQKYISSPILYTIVESADKMISHRKVFLTARWIPSPVGIDVITFLQVVTMMSVAA